MIGIGIITLSVALLFFKAIEIRGCLNSLKESYKELLILEYEMELSYKEIGKLLGFPEQTVKTYLFRARTEFKSIWRNNH